MALFMPGTPRKLAERPAFFGPGRARKIGLIGSAPKSLKYAPWRDPSWEFWAHASAFLAMPHQRADVLFDVHPKHCWQEARKNGFTDYFEFLRRCPTPVYMQNQYKDIPQSVRYPFEEIAQQWPDVPFGSMTAYMVALALYQGVTHLGCWGIDYAHRTEYCLAPETPLLTSDLRWVSAWTIGVGDLLAAFDEHHVPHTGERYWREATVLGVSVVKRPCYRIHFSDGATVVASAEHQWLCHVNQLTWKTTDKLVTPQHRHPTRVVKAVEHWGAPTHSWEAGYLAAAFDGEGHLSGGSVGRVNRHVHLGYSQRPNLMSDMVESALDTYGFRWNCQTNGAGGSNYYIMGGKPEIVRFLGQVRPQRLLALFNIGQLGVFRTHKLVDVVSSEFLGEREVIGFSTSTKTCIAAGFASHNSEQRANCEHWLGIARGMGVHVIIPKVSPLCHEPALLYGYESHTPELYAERKQRFRAAKAAAGPKGDPFDPSRLVPTNTPEAVAAADQKIREVDPAWAEHADKMKTETDDRPPWLQDILAHRHASHGGHDGGPVGNAARVGSDAGPGSGPPAPEVAETPRRPRQRGGRGDASVRGHAAVQPAGHARARRPAAATPVSTHRQPTARTPVARPRRATRSRRPARARRR